MFEDEKIYMPTPALMARGNKMGRGPYEKSSIVDDTALHPGKKVKERFEIFFPAEDGEILENEMEVTVQLWYKPFGNMSQAELWREWTQTINLEDEAKPATY